MARKRRLHKRYGGKKRRTESNPSRAPRRNPPLLSEIGEFVLPGFAGFAATRMLTRMAAVQIAKRKPAWAKHAGALASIGSFVAAWLGVNRVKMLEKHHTPIVVGSAIAAIQSLIQLYVPMLGWVISDASPEIDDTTAATSQLAVAPNPQQIAAAARLQPVNEDPAWYTYDDKFDAGRYAKETGAAAPTAGGSANPKQQAEEALLADLQLDDETANMGVFGN